VQAKPVIKKEAKPEKKSGNNDKIERQEQEVYFDCNVLDKFGDDQVFDQIVVKP